MLSNGLGPNEQSSGLCRLRIPGEEVDPTTSVTNPAEGHPGSRKCVTAQMCEPSSIVLHEDSCEGNHTLAWILSTPDGTDLSLLCTMAWGTGAKRMTSGEAQGSSRPKASINFM